jgi:vacuolar-type H+-ATPase subunit I/STV1
MWSNKYLSVDSIFNVLKQKDIDVKPASIQKMKKLLTYESMIRDALIEFVKQFDIKQNEFKLNHAQARVREMLKHVQQVINKSDIKADIEFITKDDHSSKKHMLNRIVEDVNWLNNQWVYTTANNITAVVSINKN